MRTLTAFCLWLSLFRPELAGAQSELSYQEATNQALSAYAAENWSRARVLFERAHALEPSARTLRALGLTSVRLKHYDRARHELETALLDARQALTTEQRTQVTEALRWMDETLSVLRVVVTPPEAQVRIDGEPVSDEVTLEPGKHELRVEASGYVPLDRTFACERAQHRTLEIALQRVELRPRPEDVLATPTVPATSTPAAVSDGSVLERWWFWTAVGALIVAGGTAAVFAAVDSSEAQPEPPGRLVRTLTVSY